MKFSDHDLQQLNANWLRARMPDELLHVSQNLLDDLKEARERLNQNPSNSSVPSGSQPPWTHPGQNAENEEDDDDKPIPPPPNDEDDAAIPPGTSDKNDSDEVSTEQSDSQSGKDTESPEPPKAPRNPGKQPGAQGFGRTQIMPITVIIDFF